VTFRAAPAPWGCGLGPQLLQLGSGGGGNLFGGQENAA